jgi:hypothetical protein
MKKFCLVICLIVVTQLCFAQNNNNTPYIDSLRMKYNGYFDNIKVQDEKALVCFTKTNFDSSEISMKEKIVKEVLTISGFNMALLIYQNKQELWVRQADKVLLLDSWYLQNLDPVKRTSKELEKTNKHPWFIYFGLNGMFGKELVNFYSNSRGGLFLYKNRWDAALFLSLGMSGKSFMFDIGANSRVYFPIKKIKMSPYIGVGVSFNMMGEVKSWDVPIYVGTSWYIGPGSIDIGIQAWRNFAVTIGYTFSPKFKK